MSKIIEEACFKVARTNMWENKPIDASPIIKYQQDMIVLALEALEHFESLGATEQDIANAIHYIEQIYALPPIKNNRAWFESTLRTILELAFPNSAVSGEAAMFAQKLMSGLQKQIE